MTLVASIGAYIGSFSLPVPVLQPGLDGSIWYAANTYRDHGLEMGGDLVHVFGPLGWLAYPLASSKHLVPALALPAVLQLLFLASLVGFSIRQRAFGACAVVALVAALFFFQDPQHLEAKVYGIVLSWWLMDLADPRLGLGAAAGAFSAFYAFAKVNMAVTLLLLLIAHLIVARVGFRHAWAWLGVKLACFLVPAGAVALMSFSSPSRGFAWLHRSLDIASGNSEAMSLVAPEPQIILALTILAGIVALGFVRRGTEGGRSGIWWLMMVLVPIFFEFKHGFVRADAHIYAFFTLAPVVAATRLLLHPPRGTLLLVIPAVVLSCIGPGISHSPITPAGWVRSLRLEGMKRLVHLHAFQRDGARRDLAAVALSSMSPEEVRILGDATVEFMPHDLSPLIGTGLRWRPSPFFQHILIRSPGADSMNAHHLAGPRGADRVLWTWHDLDGVHPMDRCPLTYRALFQHYRFEATQGVRLLLRKGGGVGIHLEPLGSVSSRWGSEVEIPHSPDMVLASVRLRRSLVGRVARALYRVPPSFILFEDGTSRRFVPSTAIHGLVVSRAPSTHIHFRHFLTTGRPHPACHSHRALRLSCPGRIRYFAESLTVDFFALKSIVPA